MTEPEPASEDLTAEDLTAEDLIEAILRDRPMFTPEQAVADTGASLEQARRLWRALGFAEYAGEQPVYTQSDAVALRTVIESTQTGALDFDTTVALTRALGQTMARLADWQVATLVGLEEFAIPGEGANSRLSAAVRLIEEVERPFEELMLYAWRRHLAAAVERVEALGAAESSLHTTTLTIGFADIVSFTALSNRLGEARTGDLIEQFESRCADAIARTGGRMIKSIGDSVLFVHADPVSAVEAAEAIVELIGRDPLMPDVRIGMATGAVTMRMGDVFGPPVNLASRLTSVARRNRLICDQATAELLPTDRFETREMPARPLRGFGELRPVIVRSR